MAGTSVRTHTTTGKTSTGVSVHIGTLDRDLKDEAYLGMSQRRVDALNKADMLEWLDGVPCEISFHTQEDLYRNNYVYTVHIQFENAIDRAQFVLEFGHLENVVQ